MEGGEQVRGYELGMDWHQGPLAGVKEGRFGHEGSDDLLSFSADDD